MFGFISLFFITACDHFNKYDESDVKDLIENELGIDKYELKYLGLGCERSESDYSYVWSVHLDGKFDFYVQNHYYHSGGTTFAGMRNSLISNYDLAKLNYLLKDYQPNKLIVNEVNSDMCSIGYAHLDVESTLKKSDDIDEILYEIIDLYIHAEKKYDLYFSILLDNSNIRYNSYSLNDLPFVIQSSEKFIESAKHDIILFYLYNNVDISNYFITDDIKNALKDSDVFNKYIVSAFKENNNEFLSLFSDEQINAVIANKTVRTKILGTLYSSFLTLQTNESNLFKYFNLEEIAQMHYNACSKENNIVTCPFTVINNYPIDFSDYHYFLSVEDTYNILKSVNYPVFGTSSRFSFMSKYGVKYELSYDNGYIELYKNDVKTTGFEILREANFLDGTLIVRFFEYQDLSFVDSRELLILTGISGNDIVNYMENNKIVDVFYE